MSSAIYFILLYISSFIFIILISVYSGKSNNESLNVKEKDLINKIELMSQHLPKNISELIQMNDELVKQLQHFNNSTIKSNPCERGWFAYLDEKCFRVIEEKATFVKSLSRCSSLDVQAGLVSIHSQQELDFLSNQLIKYNNISDNVWIGLKYTNKSFKWLDNTDSDYNNWSDDAVRNESMPCVHMSIGKSSLGKWVDITCNRKALIVCQKKQSTLTVFAIDLKNITKVVDRQQIIINKQGDVINEQGYKIDKQNQELIYLKQTSLPIGFIYTQLPNQSSPIELWPQTVWREVTEEYSGLFFRAEGGNSGLFGEKQPQNYSRISNVKSRGLNNVQNSGSTDFQYKELPEGQWSSSLVPGDAKTALFDLYLYTTACDNRPINTAVKIWKRIQ